MAQQLIQDSAFQLGFWNRNTTTPSLYEGPTQYDTSFVDPIWNVVEWNSRSRILNLNGVDIGTGMYSWADAYKDLRFGVPGAESYQLYMAVNSQNEYNNVYRKKDAPWAHMLVEQRLSPPFLFSGHSEHGPGCPGLNSLDSLVFDLEAILLYNNTVKTTGYDPAIHAAQFLIYFTIQNLNPSNSGYKKYIWLGVPVYDDRRLTIPGFISYDEGTQTLIYSIDQKYFMSESLHNQNWTSIHLDLLPFAKEALDSAWTKGFLTESTDYNDYKIGDVNMGWELFGMNISTVAVRDISLKAFEKIECNGFSVNIGNDRSICTGEIVELTPGSGYKNYLWSTGDTSQEILVDTGGFYHVTVRDTDNCQDTDTVHVSFNTSFIINDTIILTSGDSVFAGGKYRYEKGNYSDIGKTVNGCDSIVHTAVLLNNPTDLKEVEEPFDIAISPNPNSGTFTISLPERLHGLDGQMRIFDLQGKILWNDRFISENKYTVRTELESGLYMLEIHVQGMKKINKIQVIGS